MRKMYFLMATVVFFMFICMPPISAQSAVINADINYDRKSGKVTISGTTANIEDGETVRLVVLKPDADLDALDSGTLSFVGAGVHIAESRVTGGSFRYDDFVLENLPAGGYIIRLASGKDLFETVLNYATQAQAFDMIKNVAASADISALIEKYNDVYNLETGEGGLFSTLVNTWKDTVYSRLTNKNYGSVDDLKDVFDTVVSMAKISQGPWGSVGGVLNKYASLLELDISQYSNLNDIEQDKVCKALVGVDYGDKPALQNALKSAVEKVKNERNAGGGGGFGGGGGGLGRAADVNLPVNVPAQDNPVSAELPEYFSDISEAAWASGSIIRLFLKGIVNGKGAGIFAPNDFVTRGEAVKMIVLSFGEVDFEESASFSDVGPDDWQYPYVVTASKLGIVKGYGDGSFGKDAFITREELSVMLYRSSNTFGITLEDKNAETAFDDGDEIAPFAAEAVKNMQMAGIINGTGNNRFDPAEKATRAQTAKMIDSMLEL